MLGRYEHLNKDKDNKKEKKSVSLCDLSSSSSRGRNWKSKELLGASYHILKKIDAIMENTINPENPFWDFHMRSQDNGTECHMTPVSEPHVGGDRLMVEGFEGEQNVEPYEGLEFESEDAARIFYNEYARRIGFGSRISNNLRSKKDRRTIARKFVCSREGFRAKKHLDNLNRVKKPRMITRIGCGAMMMVKKTELGKWVVTRFVKEHNHPLLSPNEVILLRSHRPSDTPKGQVRASDGAILDMYGAEASGISNLGFIEQDGGSNIVAGELEKCINLTETVEEFESNWELLLDRNLLHNMRGPYTLGTKRNVKRMFKQCMTNHS
ncbi:hypothetical protein MRB53_025255 [Persea americana]|uniref:Uncharacterized protein n=1 Tax=Persea americana TaxID=3435 RepID=A0ACC2LFW6_PERAE|nr:hypothetical protein MRB53_025255 [Persea americana]